jgi:UDP-2,3-diacylglucosamine pyrophosphatase LpxH
MWRRDASGVFVENYDIVGKLEALMRKMRVHYIAGNHDFHLLNLQNHAYPFNFVKNLVLTDGGQTYRFLHGYEFDPFQTEVLMEALCRVMSDGGGDFENGVWGTITRDWSDLEFILTGFLRKGGIRRKAEALQQKPEQRLQLTLSGVERSACASVAPGEVLVFGHTHRPFINRKENVANSGSWVTDSPIHNTYLRLEGRKPRLFVFGGQEITERADC